MAFIDLRPGLAVSWIGVQMLYQRLRPQVVVVRELGVAQAEACTNPNHNHHSPFHFAYHSETDSEPSSVGRLFTVGFFTELIPCPSALAILLSSIGVHHVSIGLALVIAFSVGMAFMMCTVEFFVVKTGNTISQVDRWRVGE